MYPITDCDMGALWFPRERRIRLNHMDWKWWSSHSVSFGYIWL